MDPTTLDLRIQNTKASRKTPPPTTFDIFILQTPPRKALIHHEDLSEMRCYSRI